MEKKNRELRLKILFALALLFIVGFILIIYFGMMGSLPKLGYEIIGAIMGSMGVLFGMILWGPDIVIAIVLLPVFLVRRIKNRLRRK